MAIKRPRRHQMGIELADAARPPRHAVIVDNAYAPISAGRQARSGIIANSY